MPIPIDTLWNIRRLNVVFAVSMIALVGVCGWAIKQDYEKTWRPLQTSGVVWDAALTEERIKHLDPNTVDKEVAAIDDELKAEQARLDKNPDYQKILAAGKSAESQISNISFEYNNRKATVGVKQSNLQDARTRNDKEQVRELTESLQSLSTVLDKQGEQLARLKDALTESKKAAKEWGAKVDDLKKQKKKLSDELVAFRKREESIAPKNPLAKLSLAIRNAPMLGFLNPSLRVKPTFVADVRQDMSFMLIDTIDRCSTCHTHIDNKNFTREKIYGYLEEELADARKYRYVTAAKAKPGDPVAIRPAATAMPEFWHYWGRKLLSPASLDKTKGKVNGIFNVIGKKLPVTYEGKPVAELKYPTTALTNPNALDPVEQARLDGIFVAALEALYRTDNDPAVATARNLALQYPLQVQTLLKAELPTDQYKQLEERYRFAMVAQINPLRKKAGYQPLDPSPVHLAHPKLDLYVDVDSKHPMEVHGCTACHDGSGNETDFVLTAHAPRSIWVDDQSGEPVLPAQLKKPQKLESKHAHSDQDIPKMDDMLAVVYPADAAVPSGVAPLHVKLGEAAEKSEGPAATIGRERPKEEVAENAPSTEYVNPVSGKTGHAVSQGHFWAHKYEKESGTSFEGVNEMWDWPMRPPEYLQANCARCHSNFHDIKEEAPVLYTGRVLFNKEGCSNCHQMDSIAADEFIAKNPQADGSVDAQRRRAGPDLRHVSSKLSKEFTSSWIWAPKAFRPSTLMPHFFMLENSSSDEEIRRTRQETKAITEYLYAAATPLAPKYKSPEKVTGDIDKGRDLFQNIGCQGCHSNLNETGEQWITTDLVQRYGFKAPDAKKQFEEMTYNERQVYALENLGEVTSTANDQRKYADGKTPIPVFMHHAPELSGIGDKLTAGRTTEQAKAWLFDWLKEPRHYSAYTVMPRLRLSDEQAMDLVAYLLAQKRAVGAPKDKPSDEFDGWHASEIPADDKKINELVAWFLRSQYSPATADKKAVDGPTMWFRAVDALTYVSTATDEPRSTDEVKARAKAKEIAAERVDNMSLQQMQLIFLGNKLISHYGCMNCHSINGMESVASPCANLSDWGQKQVSKLDFGFLDEHKVHSLPEKRAIPMVNGLSAKAVTEIAKVVDRKDWSKPIAESVQAGWPRVEHERAAWLQHKLLNSRVYDRGKNSLDPVRKVDADGNIVLDKEGNPVLEEMAGAELRGKPYDKLKMPTFYFNEEEVHAITTFVLSNRTKLISDKMLALSNTETSKRIAHGRQITERYNCVGCHQTELNFPPVHQYYENDKRISLAPPSLRGEGNKIQHNWLFGFLKNVELIRPALFMRPEYEAGKPGIRMPSFPVTDEEATAIAEYFASVSNHEAKDLKQRLDTVIKYVDAQRKATTQPLSEPQKVWPGDDWIEKETNSLTRDYLKNWVIDRKLMLESAFDLTKPANTPDAMKLRYREALYDARFIMDLYDAPYPFIENAGSSAADTSEANARFKAGEGLFYEMQCLKCHYVGDISKPGANTKPTAPNLANVHRRLQKRWTLHWVQEPPLIQVGTLMPAFFSGISAFKLDGLPWPLGTASIADLDDAAKMKQFGADTEKVFTKYGVRNVREQKDLLLDYVFQTGQKRDYYTPLDKPMDVPTTGPSTGPATGPTSGPSTRPATGPTTKPATAPAGGPSTRGTGVSPVVPPENKAAGGTPALPGTVAPEQQKK